MLVEYIEEALKRARYEMIRMKNTIMVRWRS